MGAAWRPAQPDRDRDGRVLAVAAKLGGTATVPMTVEMDDLLQTAYRDGALLEQIGFAQRRGPAQDAALRLLE